MTSEYKERIKRMNVLMVMMDIRPDDVAHHFGFTIQYFYMIKRGASTKKASEHWLNEILDWLEGMRDQRWTV